MASSQLQEMIGELKECSLRARAVSDGLSTDVLTRRAAPESWSIAECIAHLTLSNRPFPAILESASAEARSKGKNGDGPYKADIVGRLLAWVLEPPPRLKVKARKPFEPVGISHVERVVPEFLSLQDELMECVRGASGLAIDRVKVVSPVDTHVKYNGWSALRIIAAHERRHLWQAENVRRRLGV